MPLVWRVNPLQLLKDNGYTTYRLRKENLFAQSTIGKFKYEQPVSWPELEKLCRLTGKNPGKLIEYVKEKPSVE